MIVDERCGPRSMTGAEREQDQNDRDKTNYPT